MKKLHIMACLLSIFTLSTASQGHAISGIPPSMYPIIAIDKLCKQLFDKMRSVNQMLETLEKEGQTGTDIYDQLLTEHEELFRQLHSYGCYLLPPIRREKIPVPVTE